MIRALGYSQSPFDPSEPGRLCRGRERWIEPFALEDDVDKVVSRLIVSGATFTDDSAKDALRGLPHAGIDAASLIAALFPRRQLLAFMEDGHGSEIPDTALGVEAYTGYRAGGRSQMALVRWYAPVSGVREIRAVLGDDPDGELVRGFVVLEDDAEPSPELLSSMFRLVGMSTLDSPPSRFQPAALPELLDQARAVVLLHRDKHGPALGVYAREPVRTEGRLDGLCDKHGALLVKFAIPPMLARWDRALAELKAVWDDDARGPFPVPASDEPSTWEPRRRRRRKDRDDDARGRGRAVDIDEDDALLVASDDDDDRGSMDPKRSRRRKAKDADEE